MIDNGLYKSIKRRSELAMENGVEYLIFEIETYGGLVKSADDIAKYLILDIGKKARTVAYVTTEAISAGAMISVSCQDIVMLENTTIGDCAPIALGGKLEGVEREKNESFIRGAFDRAAKANGYPQALLRAMVSMQIEVYRVKNLKTGEDEFVEGVRLDEMDPNEYDLGKKKLIVEKDKLLTLTASDAVEYGIARAQVNGLDGVLDFLAERDGVTFAGEPVVLRTSWSEQMVRWINSPAVMAVLVMLAMLGAYIELSSPGLGLPGLVAVVCVVTIVGSKYLIDMANWVEMLILVVGVLLLMVEIFVLPGFGVAGFLGILCILGGLFGMLVRNPPGEVPWPDGPVEWDLFADGAMGLLAGFAGFVALAWLIARYLPHIPFLRGLILSPNAVAPGGGIGVSMTSPPSSGAKSVEIGQRGEVVSPLRPAGKARFGESIVDVVAVAEFIEKGVSVEIIGIHGNRVVVRAAES
jgi:membrane-bound serine protease (ClpP class)